MLSLWNPFLPVKSLSDSKMSAKTYFDRLFEDSFNSAFQDLSCYSSGIESKKLENGNLLISIDVPGIQESDLSIEISSDILTINGKRKTETSSYSLHKSLSIPKGYNTDNIIAELKDGVLTIKMDQVSLDSKESKKIFIKK